MTALRPDDAPASPDRMSLTRLLSAQAPTGASAFGQGTNHAELARLVEAMASRVLAAGSQEPTESRA